MGSLHVALLHEKMLDKQGNLITTSLTMLDLHDISRSSRTYGVESFYAAHPAPAMRELAYTLTRHWSEGHGSTYNPDRKDALSILRVVSSFHEVLQDMEKRYGKKPCIIATSARRFTNSLSYEEVAQKLKSSDDAFLLLFGTGWGMSEELLQCADYILAPIEGTSDYNHLSVRSACAIVLDRIIRRV